MQSKNKDKSKHEGKGLKKKSMNAYMKYTGMAFQMGAVILVGVLIGQKLDQHFETEQAVWTAVFALLATVGAVYYVIKDEL